MTQLDRLADLSRRIASGERARRRFGSALRSARRRAGLNQTEVAALLGVTNKHVNQVERGTAMPSPEFAALAVRKLRRLEDGRDHSRAAKKRETAGRPRKT